MFKSIKYFFYILLSCNDDYYQSKGVCVKCPVGCTLCDSETACKNCSDGYLLKDGKCTPGCIDGKYLSSGTC